MSAELSLFDVEDGVLRPTVHCYSLRALRTIMDQYPDDYLEIYKYLFYMCSHNAKKNPFFDRPEHEKSDQILAELNSSGFNVDDDEIEAALVLCKMLFTTPTSDAYLGVKTMLENVTHYMRNTAIKDGRDGNLTALVNAASKFDSLRQSFKGVYKDLMEEQSVSARGGQSMAYDQ